MSKEFMMSLCLFAVIMMCLVVPLVLIGAIGQLIYKLITGP